MHICSKAKNGFWIALCNHMGAGLRVFPYLLRLRCSGPDGGRGRLPASAQSGAFQESTFGEENLLNYICVCVFCFICFKNIFY